MNSQWRKEAGDRLALMFGPYVSEMVMSVTKPMIDGVEIKDKSDVKRVYLEQLRNASPEAIVVKMADRLHNLSTLHFRSHEDQVKVARETLDDYLPIFREKSLPFKVETWWAPDAMEEIATQYLDDDAMEIRVKGELVPRLYQTNLGLHHQDLSAAA
jgi:(p)ppGpp synthase/HD superfamily hydrolase